MMKGNVGMENVNLNDLVQAKTDANPHLTGTSACELQQFCGDELGFVLFSKLVEEYYQKTLFWFCVAIFFVT